MQHGLPFFRICTVSCISGTILYTSVTLKFHSITKVLQKEITDKLHDIYLSLHKQETEFINQPV